MLETTPQVVDAQRRYEKMKREPLALDITRGKPSAAQLDLSGELLGLVGPNDYRSADGTDCRNYGGLDGLPEARALFGSLLDVAPELVMIGGNSSLALMHEVLDRAMTHGVPGGSGPWFGRGPRFLCPSPGYDRHFAMTENLGIEMVPVTLSEAGLDLEAVERLVAEDPRIKGMWIVPRYSNPVGVTLSPEEVRALARMKTAAPDFRIFWDDAYCCHVLEGELDPLVSGIAAGQEAGNPDRFVVFASFSKITFAGGGISAMASSAANLEWMRRHHAKATIGPDKLNQLRHVRFFPSVDAVHAHMQKHASILRPKFECVERVLRRELAGPQLEGLARWTRPRGGYFVSLDTMDGRATRVVQLADEAGLKLTAAGSAFPYQRDPRDRNIRIAPSFPPLEDLERAIEVLALSIICASAEG